MVSKEKNQQAQGYAVDNPSTEQSLGDFLGVVRGVKKMTLRAVEEASGGQVSNAYLSQLEKGKIAKPSPNVLHALSQVYGVSYDTLMGKAGYIASNSESGVVRASARRGPTDTLAGEQLSKEEVEKLLEYLAFLRMKQPKS